MLDVSGSNGRTHIIHLSCSTIIPIILLEMTAILCSPLEEAFLAIVFYKTGR